MGLPKKNDVRFHTLFWLLIKKGDSVTKTKEYILTVWHQIVFFYMAKLYL